MVFQVIIDGFSMQVDSKQLPYGEVGRGGSLLDIALSHGRRLQHTCGGAGSCTTCHVYVKRGLESCGALSRAEENRLQEVYGRQANSRLACQCIPNGSTNVEVEIP